MANNPGSIKRARQSVKRRAHNTGMRSMVRTYAKKVLAVVASGDYEAAQAAYAVAVPKIDSMAGKGLIKKNKASRWKSRLNAKVKALQS